MTDFRWFVVLCLVCAGVSTVLITDLYTGFAVSRELKQWWTF